MKDLTENILMCSSTSRMGLVLNDILPLDLKQYDKNQPPRFEGQPTIVYFHVTVLSVDSINEESMVNFRAKLNYKFSSLEINI